MRLANAPNIAELEAEFSPASSNIGTCATRGIRGTEQPYLRIKNIPSWAITFEDNRHKLKTTYTVQRVNSGVSYRLWGVVLEHQPPNANAAALQQSHDRPVNFGQTCAVTYTIPDLDTPYEGVGLGWGFQERKPHPSNSYSRRTAGLMGYWPVGVTPACNSS